MPDKPSGLIGFHRPGNHRRSVPELIALVVVAVVTVVLALVAPAGPAYADPTDDEGGTQALRDKLEETARGYYEAKIALTASQKRSAEITKRLRESELSLVRLNVAVGEIAAARYKGSQLSLLNGLLTGDQDTGNLLRGVAMANYLVLRDDEQLREYRETRDEAARQRALLDAEMELQRKQLAELDKQKRAAEKALASVGGMVTAGYSGPTSAAQPAPRTADGGWPRESCSYKDPTDLPLGGCLTPRTYHALQEARLAHFTRYTHCWRWQSWGEHPKGRACDFSVTPGGFRSAAATGGDKAYGSQLAAWCMANAEALGVLYVIWYRQIWMPGIGWRAYFGHGDPASEHTNHVHLSII